MYVLGDFLLALAKLVDYVLYAYMWIIVIRALLSWVNPDPWNPIVRFLLPGDRARASAHPPPAS